MFNTNFINVYQGVDMVNYVDEEACLPNILTHNLASSKEWL
jgi:hypothetical protein